MNNILKRIKSYETMGRNETRTGEYEKELVINLRIEKYIH